MTQAALITTNVTHKKAHADELLIVWIFSSEYFKEQVSTVYPGAATASLLFWDDLPQGTTREEWEAEGYNFFGRWGGDADEHATRDAPRKEGESAVSLVARKLGIEGDLKFKDLLKWTMWLDLNLGRSAFQLPAIIKMMNDMDWDPNIVMQFSFFAFETIYAIGPKFFGPIKPEAGKLWAKIFGGWMRLRFSNRVSFKELNETLAVEDPLALVASLRVANNRSLKRVAEFTKERFDGRGGTVFEPHVIAEAMYRVFGHCATVEWAFKVLDIIYQQTRDFREIASMDFEKATIHTVEIGNRVVKVVVGVSDSLQFARYARSSFGCKAGVVIVQRSTGNVCVFTDSHLELDLSEVVALLRIQEFLKQGSPAPENSELLRGENEIPGGDVWHFFKNGRMILNGSTTRTLPPTILDLRTITGIFFAGMKVKGFSVVSFGHRYQSVQEAILAQASA